MSEQQDAPAQWHVQFTAASRDSAAEHLLELSEADKIPHWVCQLAVCAMAEFPEDFAGAVKVRSNGDLAAGVFAVSVTPERLV